MCKFYLGKNFNTFLKKTKVILNKCNDILFSLTERFNILNIPICPKLTYKYEISIKIIASTLLDRHHVSKAYMVINKNGLEKPEKNETSAIRY